MIVINSSTLFLRYGTETKCRDLHTEQINGSSPSCIHITNRVSYSGISCGPDIKIGYNTADLWIFGYRPNDERGWATAWLSRHNR